MPRRHSSSIKVSLRLCFVKLPSTQDCRVFRDVMLLREPEDKCFQDLSDIVEKKLSFMEIPPADFTVLHTESTTGDRVVVDDAYMSELIAGWFKQLYATRARTRRRRSKSRLPVVSARSVSQEAQTPYVLGEDSEQSKTAALDVADGPSPLHRGRGSMRSERSADDSDSDDDDDDSQRESGPLEIAVTFDVEVNRLRPLRAAATAPTAGQSPLGLPAGPGATDLAKVGGDGGLTRSLSSPSVSQQQRGVVVAAEARRDGGGYDVPGEAVGPSCVPLTIQNLTALMQQGALSSSPPPPPLPPRPQQAQQPATCPGETLVSIADLVCPPQPALFYLRCVVVGVRFKMPKPGLTIGEMDLCDAADPRQVITAVTFDASVQREIKENLRCDGRQVLELRRVYVRRKSEIDMRYATNAHPLLLRIDRSSKLEVVQLLAVPITSRAPVVSAAPYANATVGGGEPVVSIRESVALRGGGGVVELTDLSRLRSLTTAAATGGGGGGDGGVGSEKGFSGVPVVNGLSSSSSSSSAGVRRTTFTMGSGNHSTAGSAPYGGGGSHALVSGVVPSAYGHQLQQQQQQALVRAAQLLQQQQQQQHGAMLHEPGVIPVTLKDVRAREALVEQYATKEDQRKERLRRKVEVSQSCILCGLDLSEGNTESCLAAVKRLLVANYRNKGTHIPTREQLLDALCDRRPRFLLETSAASSPGGGAGGSGGPTSSSIRLTCQQTFVNLQSRTHHVVHCRCAHLCTEYQNGGNLEDIAWCDLPTQVCSLCGQPGAYVACYHPDCKELYHAVCALFSGGYVNFGKKDPFLPCPACPRHTQVILSHGKKGGRGKAEGGGGVLHVDESCWDDDDIAFDSRVVAAGDLRDPDENDGE